MGHSKGEEHLAEQKIFLHQYSTIHVFDKNNTHYAKLNLKSTFSSGIWP